MARLVGPDDASRVVYLRNGLIKGQGRKYTLYADADKTQLADVLYLDDTPVPGSVVTVDAWSKLPLLKYPDGLDVIYGASGDGPVVPLSARYDARIDTLEATAVVAQGEIDSKAPINNPTFTGTTSGITKVMVGLGNVDNTADTVKPISTAQQTALNAKLTRGETFVNVLDYGAVGDTLYIDQRVSAGKFGLASAVPQEATFGYGFKDSTFTQPATDNTTAFRAAWDAALTAGKFSLLQRSGSVLGFRGSRVKFHIPAGAYYISDAAALFSTQRVSPSGTQVGFDITGDGHYNTILYIRITGTGPLDYLFHDNNWGNGVNISGVTIVGVTGNERFIYHTSTGNAKRWRINECTFRDYKTFLTVDGVVNADRWVLNGCGWSTEIAGACVMSNQVNTQAIGFDFHSPSIAHMAGGNVFDVGAGGHIRIFGGSTDMFGLNADGAAGRFAYVHGTGATLGYQLVPVITVNDHKFEIHDDQGLADVNWNSIVFRDCNAPTIGSTRWANGLKHHIVVRGRGSFVWDGGMFGDMYLALSTNLTDDFSVSIKAQAIIKDAWLENNDFLNTRVGYFTSATDGLTTSFVSQTGTASGVGIGRVMVEGCSPLSASYIGSPPTHLAVNGAPYAGRSWFGRPVQSQRAVHRHGSALAFGLPAEGQTAVIRVPMGCQFTRAGIVKGATQSGISTNSRTWKVTDGNGTVLATLTTLGTTFNVSAVSTEQFRTLATDNDRTFTLSCDPAAPSSTGTGAEGYFFIDYI